MAPPDYVEGLFDQYAERFDTHLVDELDYRTPELLRDSIAKAMPERCFARALDLGCGTGLAGVALRDRITHLTGIDLASKMVAVAREKDTYDALHVGDIVAFVDAAEERWDLFAAADVLVYIGDLAPLFAAVRRAASPEAVFAFSVESGEGESYALTETGRYAHAPAYINALAAAHGFEIVCERHVTLRKQQGEPVAGDIYVLRGV